MLDIWNHPVGFIYRYTYQMADSLLSSMEYDMNACEYQPLWKIMCQTETLSHTSTDKVNVTFLFLSRFLLRSLQVDGHFLIWLLTGWRPCWQPLRNHVWKLLLAKIKFKRDHFNKANSWSDTLLNRGHMHVNHHIIYSHRLHPKNTVCNLFCLVCRQWIFPYSSGLRHWHWGNHRILPLPVK